MKSPGDEKLIRLGPRVRPMSEQVPGGTTMAFERSG
jgi:hypothetical protein